MIDNTTLEQLVQDVCHTMLGLPVTPADVVQEMMPTMLASISITGPADWIVEVEATAHCARRIAAALFAMSADDLSLDEVCDALGELVNIIGGNLKGIMCEDATLSLPCVELDEVVRVARTAPTTSIHMLIDSASLHVRLTPAAAMAVTA